MVGLVPTFQGERLVQAPGGLLQLSVLGGGLLRGPGGQQVRVGVGLDGAQWGRVGVRLALLHGQEGAAGFGAGHLDSLIGLVSAAGGRGSRQLLGGVAVVEELMVRRDWLPVVVVGLLSLQLLLFPPNVIQQDLAVPAPSHSASSSPCPSPIRKSTVRPRPSVGQRFRAPEQPGCVGSPGPRLTVHPQSCLRLAPLLLWRVDAVQESIRAVTVASRDDRRRSRIRRAGRGGGLQGARREGGRVKGERRRVGGRKWEGPVVLKSLGMVAPERQGGTLSS